MTAPLRIAADPAEADTLPGVRRSVRVGVAAQLLDCTPNHIRLMLRQGTLEGHTVGKRGVRVFVDSLRAMQEGRPAGVAPKAPPARRIHTAAHREAMATLHKLGIT